MKKNRSNKWTNGVTNVADKKLNLKYPFFEYDTCKNELEDDNILNKIKSHYIQNLIPYIIHRTGNGWHFLSPFVMTPQEWLLFMNPLRDINKKCPMTTLRIKPNKYENEKDVWYWNQIWYIKEFSSCSHQMSQYLNGIFGSHFKGELNTLVEIVKYPLPFSVELNPL